MASCVVLFSGGIDSTTALVWALHRFDEVTALSFDYGQRHRVELTLAGRMARRLRVPRVVLKVDLRQVGGSALTDARIPVPSGRAAEPTPEGPPATYVPFRNGIFLALAAAWAEARGIHDIVCGFHVQDSPEYPDTRREFVRAMERAVNAGTRAAFGAPRMKIQAPFVTWSKAHILREGLAMGVDYSWSVSCYAGGEIPCGTCASCSMRAKGWAAVGAEDHLIARLRKEGKT